jgi:hypothetical protein
MQNSVLFIQNSSPIKNKAFSGQFVQNICEESFLIKKKHEPTLLNKFLGIK